MTMIERRAEESRAAPNRQTQAGSAIEEGKLYRDFLSMGNPDAPTMSELESVKQPETPGRPIIMDLLDRLPLPCRHR